ncbi:hypothetical protein PRIC2_002115 [Phytophthora ramorum]
MVLAKAVLTMVPTLGDEEEREKAQWFINKFEIVQILILVEYLFMFVMCFALALYLRRNRHIALTGNFRAARKILLPAFAPLLWLLGCTVGLYSVVMLLLVSLKWRGRYSNVLLEIFYCMRLFVFGLVMVFLLQKSVSVPALRRSVMITLILALYTLPVEILLSAYVESSSPNLAFVVMSSVRALMLVFFAYVFVRPPARASKRTLREYCFFIFTYSALYFSTEFSFHLGESRVGFALIEKFPELRNNHLQVFACVVEGRRPELELETGSELHSSLREIIEAAWQPDARLRPNAQDIVKALEGVQEELLAVFATEFLPELSNDISSSACKTNLGTADVFTGELIVARLQDMKFLHSPCEAVRLGNAFMDAGLLHHKKHAYCFENTSVKYFFDEENIRLCQPLEKGKQSVAIQVIDALNDDLEQQQEQFGSSSSSSRRGSSTCSFSEDHSSVQNNPTEPKPFSISEVFMRPNSGGGTSASGGNGCRCRKLGRRLEPSRTARKQRLRRKFKAAIADDFLLTTKLLEGDDAAGTPTEFEMGNTMDGFDFVVLAA